MASIQGSDHKSDAGFRRGVPVDSESGPPGITCPTILRRTTGRTKILYFLLPDRFSDDKDRPLLTRDEIRSLRTASSRPGWNWKNWADSGRLWQGGTIAGIAKRLPIFRIWASRRYGSALCSNSATIWTLTTGTAFRISSTSIPASGPARTCSISSRPPTTREFA